MRPRTVALTALFLSAAGSLGAQQPVLLRLGGRVGDVVHGRMVMNSFMRGGPMDAMVTDTALPTMHVTTYFTRTLDAIAGDTLVFTGRIDSSKVETPGSPGFGAMLPSAAALARRPVTIRMDGRGTLFSTDSTSTAAPGAPERAAFGGVLGARGAGAEQFAFPAEAVRVGQMWDDSSSTTNPQTGAEIRTRHRYRLERIEPRGDAGTAILTMSGTVTIPTTLGAEDAPFAGVIAFDVAAHRVRAMAATTVYRHEMSQGEIYTRTEMTQTEDGDTALAVPVIPAADLAAAPAAQAPTPAPPRTPSRPVAPADTAVGVEVSPVPTRFTIIRLGTPPGQLNALLAEHVRRARAAGRRAFVEFEADWCGPCHSLNGALNDARMVEAFDGTYIVKVNSDRWMARLAEAGFDASAIPVFYELDDAGRPTGRKIDGGAWGEDIPANMAPPLRAFFHPRAGTGR